MSATGEFGRNLRFLKMLFREKSFVRSLLESPNLKFVKGFPPGHFYSPVPDLAEIRKSAKVLFDRSMTTLNSIDINEQGQVDLMRSFFPFYDEIPFPDKQAEGHRYFFDNPYFSYGDGIILYSFLRHFRPKRIIEIGSGFSSAEMLDINELFLNNEIQFTFIEPFPDRLIGLLSDEDRKFSNIQVKPVQDMESATFAALTQNDILFIDSSHVAKAASDLLRIVFEILPLLRKGVIVHFHDVLWPFEYPESWIEGGRVWNEAYFLRAFLQYNAGFEVLFFNSYMALHHSQEIGSKMPRILRPPSLPETMGNTSLWLRKVV